MFSVKKNVLQIVALLKAYGVEHIVISPGSRNAPLIQTFTGDSYFKCHTIVDERNAAFYAIGIMQCLKQPVAVCCTSGSALLNYSPAVSEAYYQQLPLIVISADRAPEWIGQMDGQTLPQTDVFGTLSKKTVNLPEINNETDEWFCNRLINEALIACCTDTQGPVHINVPISEPLFDYTQKNLPEVRKISYIKPSKSVDIDRFTTVWNTSEKRLIIVGQGYNKSDLTRILERIVEKTDCVVFTEHISNCISDSFVSNFDALLYTFSETQKKDNSPDLVMYAGGHITSKRLKHFLRQHKPKQLWHISEAGEVLDLFQSLTDVVESDVNIFFTSLLSEVKNEEVKPFYSTWKNLSEQILQPDEDVPFSDLSVMRDFAKYLSEQPCLHLANSSTVRNIQLFSISDSIEVYSNRGVNGIESSLPTAIGFAAVSGRPVYLVIGDLSFFYTLSALWNIQHIKNLRILLVNNGGGAIFHLLPGLNTSSSLKEHVSAEHGNSAEGWANAAGLHYFPVRNNEELKEGLSALNNKNIDKSVLVEVFTDMEINKKTFQEYYNKLKTYI